MKLYNNSFNITGIFYKFQNGSVRSIQKIYNGTKLIWEYAIKTILTAFGSGVWLNEEKWDNNDMWKNNK